MKRRFVAALVAAGSVCAAESVPVADLTPVKIRTPDRHASVELVSRGCPAAVVYVAGTNASPALARLVGELVDVIRATSGATLPVATNAPAADQPAIVIGDCAESRAAGIEAAKLPIEGFEIKTAPNRVFLVGSTQALPAGSTPHAYWSNEGTAWAVADFLERVVGVRWYWPADLGGRSVRPAATLAVEPLHYADRPVFRQRQFFPHYGWKLPEKARWFDKEPLPFPAGAIPAGVTNVDMPGYLPLVRNGNSWPYLIKVHEPQNLWRDKPRAWMEANASMFALKADGTRNESMFCYSNPKTFDYLLAGCENTWNRGGGDSWVTPTCVTVSPADEGVDCRCEGCLKSTAEGGASLIMGRFVKRVCEEVKRRWPDKKVMYLPYWNYQFCPESVDFPDNLEVMVCTTHAPMALMRQAEGREKTERNLRAWSKKTGGMITTWDYSDRGSGWTYGPVQYPHVVRRFYRDNRDHLAGSFLNGGILSDWTTTAPTLYVWMKAMWNPDLDVDAALDEMCRRLYGKAAPTVRALLRLQCERWEDVPWTHHLADEGRIPPELFAEIWPPDVRAEMKRLRDQALAELADDPAGRQRLLYWTWTFDAFLKNDTDQRTAR